MGFRVMGALMKPKVLSVTLGGVMLLLAQLTFGQDSAPRAAEESLKQFLQSWDNDKTTRYVAAFRDLNGDGTPEAIVYFIGKDWCGSGGCPTLILTRDAGSWRIVTKITITQPPIRVLTNTSHGWRSIGVWVQGGGIQQGYEATPLQRKILSAESVCSSGPAIEGETGGRGSYSLGAGRDAPVVIGCKPANAHHRDRGHVLLPERISESTVPSHRIMAAADKGRNA